MFEGDDDDHKRQLKKAEANRAFDPHAVDRLKQQYERKQKQERTKLQNKLALQKMAEDTKKQKQEMNKKGIASIDQKEDAKKLLDDEKRTADADKARGPETPTKTA